MKSDRKHPRTTLHRRRCAVGSNEGSSMFLVLLLSVALATVLGGIFAYVSLAAKDQRRSDVRQQSMYAAEYAFGQAFDQLNNLIFQNGPNLPGVAQTTAVTNLSTAPTAAFPASDGYTWKAFITVPMQDEVPVASFTSFDPTNGIYRYITAVEFTHTTGRGTPPVDQLYQQEWVYTIVPLFQYAIFYNSSMELFPGAAFNVGGRVHANGQVFTGTTASITFAGAVSSVSGVVNSRMPIDPRGQQNLNGPINYNGGNPTVTNTQNPPGQLGANLNDANVNNDGARELIEIPNLWQQDENADSRMYNKAGLKVLRNTGASAVTTASGVTVNAGQTVLLTRDGTQISAELYTYLTGTTASNNVNAFRSDTVDDYRENATGSNAVTVVDVRADQLNQAYNDGGLPQVIPATTTWPNNSTVPSNLRNKTIPAAIRGKDFWNGIVYVSDVSNSSSHRTGVQLRGQQLPNGSRSDSPSAGLTVVTDNAAYINGDYNTGGTPPVNSGSNLAANNYASGYTVQPAAVIADAVTVLSSNWDTNGANSALSARPAANTTINAALISGIVPTSSNAYSGGVENYIRLLENWSGYRLTYYGSMVNLYNSQQSTGFWRDTGNYYNAPSRNWYFDINFLNPNRLPPGTPVIRTLMRGRWALVDR